MSKTTTEAPEVMAETVVAKESSSPAAASSATSPAPKKGSKLWIFLILGCAGLLLLSICCVVLFFLFGSPSGVSTSQYINSTESNFQLLDGYVLDVEDSIKLDLGSDSSNDSYQTTETNINNAYKVGGELESKAAEFEKTIPVANSDSKTTDTKLKDYYTTAKEFGASYKSMVSFYKDSLPVMADFDDFATAMKGLSQPTTADDYKKYSTTINIYVSKFTKDKTLVSGLSTTSENAFKKASFIKMLDSTVVYLTAFAKFADKMVPAIQQNSQDLATAAVNEFTKAQTTFDDSSKSDQATDKTASDNLKQKYIDKGNVVDAKKLEVETGFTGLKALVK